MRYQKTAKRTATVLLLLLLIVRLCGCGVRRGENDPLPSKTPTSEPTSPYGENEIHAKAYPFSNYTGEYEVADGMLTTYFVGNRCLPYADVYDFLCTLRGFLKTDELTVSYNDEEETVCLCWTYVEDEESMQSSGHAEPETTELEMKIDAKADTVWINSTDFFVFTNDTLSTNYGEFLVLDHYDCEEGSEITFPLGDYGFDVLFTNGKCILPFCFLNLFFCSGNMYNVYFNGEAYFGVWGGAEDEMWERISDGPYRDTQCPADLRDDTVRFINFVMNYYYGLKDVKGYTDFLSTLAKETISALQSTSPAVYTAAYGTVFHDKMQDLHTSISNVSLYNAADDTLSPYDTEDDTSRWSQFMTRYLKLYYGYLEAFPEGVSPVRVVGNTAFILLESFRTGAQSELYDADGNQTEDAVWLDSCLFMRQCMEEIAKIPDVENVVLDLSLNTGGNIGACMTLLGFLTDEPIPVSTYNRLSGEYVTEYYRVDTDGDGKTEGDAYVQYTWYVKTSSVTFSAANMFTAIAEGMGVAEIVGQKSGGGMCSVLNVVLPDGTCVRISSDDAEIIVRDVDGERVYCMTEDGVEPAIAIEEEYFFDDAYLVGILAK